MLKNCTIYPIIVCAFEEVTSKMLQDINMSFQIPYTVQETEFHENVSCFEVPVILITVQYLKFLAAALLFSLCVMILV